MDVLPLRPLLHHRPRPTTSRTTTTHTGRPAHPAHAPDAEAPSADEIALIAQQTQFDLMMQARAEAEREANALRDLAMAQVKHDDQAMRESREPADGVRRKPQSSAWGNPHFRPAPWRDNRMHAAKN